MTHLRGVAMASLVTLLLSLPAEPGAVDSKAGRPKGTDDFEARILAELVAMAPAAEEDARVASAAYESRRWQEAFDAYARVLAAAPGFDHALRRQCRARTELGERAEAIPLCRAALALATTPLNELALASALVARVPDRPTPRPEVEEALTLASRGLARAPGDASIAAEACAVALATSDLRLLTSCSSRLDSLAPRELATTYVGAIRALGSGDFHEARRRVAEARLAGLPEEEASRLERAIDGAEPAWSRWRTEILVVLGAWIAALPLLLLAGSWLSGVTAGRARFMVTGGEGGGGAGWLRRVYAVVLWLTCAVYYLSLPLLVLLLVAAAYAVWWKIETGGGVPVRGVLLVGMTVLVSVWAVARSLWVSVIRPRMVDPGVHLEVADHPRFEAALREAAARVGTRPVDDVFLTPGTDAAVYETGGLLARMRARSRRCLILGIGVLDGMTQGQLKAVLAHEYGHFVNRDTAGGGLALAVRRSMWQMGQTMADGGVATWYNPAWLFVTNFHRLFLRVSQGASRLQEILADRWAVRAYGGANFAMGLSHVVATSVRFRMHADATLQEVMDRELSLPNIYRYAPSAPPAEESVAEEVEKVMNAPPSPYESHPRPVDRIAWVADVHPTHASSPDDDTPAWELLADREALERRLTDEVRAWVAANRGVKIPAVPAPEESGSAGGAAG